MKYKIEITGMHCTGCSNLIKMTLEDEELSNVIVNATTGDATFESSLAEIAKVKTVIDKAFADLSGYSYSNIQAV